MSQDSQKFRVHNLYIAASPKMMFSPDGYTFKLGYASDMFVRSDAINGLLFDNSPLYGESDWKLFPFHQVIGREQASSVETSIFQEFGKYREFFIDITKDPKRKGSGYSETFRISYAKLPLLIKNHYKSENSEFKKAFIKFREVFELFPSPRRQASRVSFRTFRDEDRGKLGR